MIIFKDIYYCYYYYPNLLIHLKANTYNMDLDFHTHSCCNIYFSRMRTSFINNRLLTFMIEEG